VSRLQQRVAAEAERRGIAVGADDGPSPAYRALIEELVDPASADALLDQVLQRYRKHYGVGPIEVGAADDVPERAVPPAGVEAAPASVPPRSVAQAQYLGLARARSSADRYTKWSALCWLKAQLVNRLECVRWLHREAEDAYLAVLDYTARLVFRKIRRHLSKDERRVFQLMYRRQASWGGRIAAVDPVVGSFLFGMDDETQWMIIQLLVTRDASPDERAELQDELRRRWRAYLRFYPYWADLIDDEDREARRRRAAPG